MSSLSTHILKKVEEDSEKKKEKPSNSSIHPLPPSYPKKQNENNEEAADEYQNFVDDRFPNIKSVRSMTIHNV